MLPPSTPATPPPPGDSDPQQQQAALRTSVANASKLTIAMAITIPLGFVTRILIPRFLGAEKAGVFFFAESFPNIVLMLLPLGISAYIQKSVPPDHSHARVVLMPIMALQAFLAFFLILGVLGYMHLVNYGQTIITVTAIMAVYQVMYIFHTEVLLNLFVAVGKINLVAIINVASKVLLVLLVLAALLFENSNLYYLGGAFLLAQLVVVLVTLRKARAAGMLGGEISLNKLKGMIQVSLPFFLAGALATSNGTIDMAVLSRMADFQEVGYYGAVIRIQGLFLMLVPLIGNALTPLLSATYARSREEYKQLASQAMHVLMIFAFALCLVNMAFGQEIIFLVYGKEFAPAAKVIGLNGLVVLFSYISIFLVQNIVIMTNGLGLAKTIAFAFFVNFVLDYLFVPIGMRMLGPGGGACGSTIATAVTEMITFMLLIKLSKKSIFTSRTTYTLAVVTLSSIAFVSLSNFWFQIDLLPRIGLFLAGVPGFLALSRVVTWRDVIEFKQLLPKRRRKV